MSPSRSRVIRWLIVSMFGFLVSQGLARVAAEPPTEPLLRLETGMHTAPIRQIDVDAQERYLVSGSDDKAVRVWDLWTGRLLRVLRPPIGPGHEGKMYAVAISPDGHTVAASGWTSASGTFESIYLFDRATGQLRQRIVGLPSAVFHLAFRPDGEVFVAALAHGGIRVYRTRDGAEVAKDEDYGGDSYGAAFDQQGRLVTTCFDGVVRLYSPSFRKIATQRAPGGTRPFAVSFSPDDQSVAVGFEDTTAVNVLSGQDLSMLFAPDTRGVDKSFLISVTWSADGRLLYAGGMYSKPGFYPIMRWGEAGRGARQELRTAAHGMIMDMKPLQTGGLVYGTADPAIGRVEASGRDQLLQGPMQADYRANLEGFLVSADGSLVQFGYKSFGQQPAQFSVPARLLTPDPPPAPNLNAPRTVAPGLTVDQWKSTTEPTLNGQPLPLAPFEISRSLAISPNGRDLLLGTEWGLRLFDQTGTQQWHTAVPSVAYSVNIPPTGAVAVAAFSDGTIRWYRLQDGEELLALFPHPDGQRWILWTPQGYYDAAAGAEELLGWHVNQGPNDEALFYPVARFREQFHRPDVVSLVLETRDVQVAIQRANTALQATARLAQGGPVTATGQSRTLQRVPDLRTALPPVVEFIGLADGTTVSTTDLAVEYILRSPTGEAVSEISGRVDGKVVTTRQEPLSGGEKEVTGKFLLPFPKRDATVSLVAKNHHGPSEPATVRLRWGLPKQGSVHANLYVLSIGIGRYPQESNINRLSFPGKDAREVATLLQGQRDGGLYRSVNIQVLDDDKATHGAILNELERVQNAAGPEDVTMVFLSGHGLKDAQGEYYFLSVDADKHHLKRTAVRGRDLSEYLTSIPGKVLVFLDTCYSGSLLDIPGAKADDSSQANVDALANALASVPGGPIVFASSTGNQLSLEREEWHNGAFSKALLEAFRGKADKLAPTGVIDLLELQSYLAERVTGLTDKKQTPRTIIPKGSEPYPVVLVR